MTRLQPAHPEDTMKCPHCNEEIPTLIEHKLTGGYLAGQVYSAFTCTECGRILGVAYSKYG